MGCRITKGVTEQCTARLHLTLIQMMSQNYPVGASNISCWRDPNPHRGDFSTNFRFRTKELGNCRAYYETKIHPMQIGPRLLIQLQFQKVVRRLQFP